MKLLSNFKNKISRNFKSRRRQSRSKATGRQFVSQKNKNIPHLELGKIRRNLFVILILISFLGLIVIWLFLSISRYASLNLKRTYKDDSEENIEWKSEGRLNVLVVGLDEREGEYGFADFIAIVMFDPKTDTVGIFDINTETVVYQKKYDKSYKLKNLYNAGILKNQDPPIRILIESIEGLVSIKIDRYIMLEEEGLISLVDTINGIYIENDYELYDEEIAQEYSDFRLVPGNYRLGGQDFLNYLRSDDDGVDNKLNRQTNGISSLLRRVTNYSTFIRLPQIISLIEDIVFTDLSKNELIRSSYEIMTANEFRSSFSEISSFDIVKNDKGEIQLKPIFEELDKDIQDVFLDESIGKEQARVEIFNSTNIKGLASFRARWLRNIGVDIIRVGDSPQKLTQTVIYAKDKDDYYNTIEAIRKTFNDEVEIINEEPKDVISTGDIIIIIGDNITE